MTTLETLLNDPDQAGVWHVDADRSAVTFTIKNMWGLLNVKGRFTEFTGDGQVATEGAELGRLDIRAASIDTGIGKRDDHLRSADFFDVERFPEISAVVTAAEPAGGSAADLRVSFTIKDVTAPVALPATITRLDDGSVRVAGRTAIDRAQFGLGWNKFGMMAPAATAGAEIVLVRATQ